MIYTATVTVTAPVYDTEVVERIKGGITNIFPGAEFEDGTSVRAGGDDSYVERLEATSHSVERLRELVNRQEINNTARSELLDSAVGNTMSFKLKKQAAYVERVNFDVGGHELGAINVHIETDDPDELVDYIAPADDGNDETRDSEGGR